MTPESFIAVSVDGELSGRADEEETFYQLSQTFTYDYDAPVRELRHRLMVVPRAVHGGQRRLEHGVTVSGSPALVSVASVEFGNHVVDVRATTVAETICFEVWARVRRSGPGGVTTLPPSSIGDGRLLAPTPLTEADAVLADAAADLVSSVRSLVGPSPRPGRPVGGLEVAERACAWAHRALTYTYDVTDVRTSAAEAVAGGRGVCQDFAHVMIALCRAAGLPARYVSGHLVGEGGSHAWVEVMVPDSTRPECTVAVAFDPTHDRRAGQGYLTVAVGRDYPDVAPTSGTFEGRGLGSLTTRKRLVAMS